MDNERYFFGDDFFDNFRDTESSKDVVRWWYPNQMRYLLESVDNPDCLRLIAERLLVRRLLGVDALEAEWFPKVKDVAPFGAGTPSLQELFSPQAFYAFAFVPVSPRDNQGEPLLMRLYCVRGLSQRYIAPLEDLDVFATGERELSWFIAGVPQDRLGKGITGHSWRLAANLLACVVERRDCDTARNLATRFIVTGDVVCGKICPVEALKKPALADESQFANFKWIMPSENNMGIAKRKVEKPATLDAAYELVKGLQSAATEELFRAVRVPSFDGVRAQCKTFGADIYALDAKTRMSPIEMAAREIERVRKDAQRTNAKKEADEKELREIIVWLKQENADCATLFYQVAQMSDNALLEKCISEYPINAVDEYGQTAVDWALNAENWEAANKLHREGGVCNARFGGNRKIQEALEALCGGVRCGGRNWMGENEKARELIVRALDCGLPPDMEISGMSVEGQGDEARQMRMNGTLFGVAIEKNDIEIVKACLRNGANARTSCTVTVGVDAGHSRWVIAGAGAAGVQRLEDQLSEPNEHSRPGDPPTACEEILRLLETEWKEELEKNCKPDSAYTF